MNPKYNEILARKKRTAATWYSDGKLCIQCKVPIVNKNNTGLCRICYRSDSNHYKSSRGESNKHRYLKLVAAAFLKEQGCDNIDMELVFPCRDKFFIIDVIGYKDGNRIVVECGGSRTKKLELVYKTVDLLYILPHGCNQPYLYQPEINVCHICGNNTSLKTKIGRIA